MNDREIRMLEFEIRAEENAEHGHFITGTPIVFGQITDLGWCREVMDTGAVDKDTDLKDVRFLIGHNTGMVPLARSRNNNENSTMQMRVTEKGMEIRVDLDIENNADAKTLYSAVKRGDISGMSFMFIIDKCEWEDIDTDNPLRRVKHIRKVFEVSAVAFPAYEGTDLQTASMDAAPDGAASALESAAKRELEELRERAKKDKQRREKAMEALRR
ncbi:MAG: HK97 family phage prohead protease [Clostridia bacterium]|nr:HK97 family phage prohead protease [Clostridia bacterium]